MRFKINSDEFANEVIKYVGRYNLFFFGQFLLLYSYNFGKKFYT